MRFSEIVAWLRRLDDQRLKHYFASIAVQKAPSTRQQTAAFRVVVLLTTVLSVSIIPGSGFTPPAVRQPNVLRVLLDKPDTTQNPLSVQLSQSDTTSTLVAEANQSTIDVFSRPNNSSQTLAELPNPTATGGPLVFQVLDDSVDGWLNVYLPIRPNGSTGWIPSDLATLTVNYYRIEIDTSEHQLTVLYRGKPRLETTVAIGDGATPTPIGAFYLTELLKPDRTDGVYGPFAFGLSGHSETLTSFNGGDGVIGLHGTNEPEALGTNVSHGCVRLHNDVISELATFLPLGTPVTIHS